MSDEVLVHISTPATRQNDELFRSLAHAYTLFQPCQTHRDAPVRKRARIGSESGLEPANLTQRNGTTMQEPATASVPAGSKESYGSFPSNLSSEDRSQNQYAASASDDSGRPTSRLAQLDRSYLSWRKRITPKSSFSRVQQQLPPSSSDPEDANTGFIEDSQLAVQALQSQLPETCSITFEDTSEDDDIQDESIGHTEGWHSQTANVVQSSHSEIAEHVQLAAVPGMAASANLEKGPLREPTDLSMHAVRASQNKVQAVADQLDFSQLPVDAFAPAPMISTIRPGTLPSQITKHLAAIKIKNPDRFMPSKIRRCLDADERGYWLVDCLQWLPRVQKEFWSLLCEHVCSGRIGWGTTLHRETGSDHKLGRVRLYCWGEVAEHAWLLLWLCSKGKVSGSGLRWIDANGVAVLEMQ